MATILLHYLFKRGWFFDFDINPALHYCLAGKRDKIKSKLVAERIMNIPRLNFAHLPTPIEELP
ncbi:MAG TPA: hypothetical protein PKV19_09065, partial [Anaerolineales bacterium]|nr:hypothetical protein [Anaerolineales bacterium]